MERAISSTEIFPSNNIRPLSNAEIDQVDGGVYSGSSVVLRIAQYLVTRLIL
ncbi:MAG TPA: hypothetical protein VFP43_01425 [Mesorhizobium sp.]|nr:hypothetical protein [Mesorhizobium sp.]